MLEEESNQVEKWHLTYVFCSLHFFKSRDYRIGTNHAVPPIVWARVWRIDETRHHIILFGFYILNILEHVISPVAMDKIRLRPWILDIREARFDVLENWPYTTLVPWLMGASNNNSLFGNIFSFHLVEMIFIWLNLNFSFKNHVCLHMNLESGRQVQRNDGFWREIRVS